MEDIKVSIICNAYNHEKYIRKCLEGFVMQKTDFAFEILVHDDASTDGTASIIMEFEEKYPELVKPVYQTENQYSKPGSSVAFFQYPRVKGKYIAICEGDDYWTDPLKLQKQYDALEVRPDIDMCATKAKEVVANTEKFLRFVEPKNETCVISLHDVIMGGGNYFATCSLLVRKEILLNPYPFKKIISLDYSLQISGALRGGVYYINEDMCSYRFLSDGSWTQKVKKDLSIQINTYLKIIEMLKSLDEFTNNANREIILDRIDYYEFQIALLSNDYREFNEHKKYFKEYMNSISFKGRVYTYLMIVKNKLKR